MVINKKSCIKYFICVYLQIKPKIINIKNVYKKLNCLLIFKTMLTMKKIIILLNICIFNLTCINAQHLLPVWVHHFGDTSYNLFGENFIQIDNNNDIVITGFLTDSQIDTFNINGLFIAKYNENGNLLWLSLPDTASNFTPNFLKISPDNSIYVLTFPKGIGSGRIEKSLIKLNNQTGNTEWHKKFILAYPFWATDRVQFRAFEIDKNNHLHFAVNLYHSIVLPNNDTIFHPDIFNKKYFVLTFNDTLDLLNTFLSFENTKIYDLKIDNDENMYHLSFLYYNNLRRLLKYDKNYNHLLNVRDFPYEFYSFHLSANDHIYTSFIGNDTLFPFNQTDSITNNNLFFTKIKTPFEIEWTKKFKGFNECTHPFNPGLFVCNTAFSCIKSITHNNHIYVYGLFKHKFGIENDTFITTDSSKYSFFISKFDESGNYYWTEIFQSKEVGDPDCYFNLIDLKVLYDGTLLFGIMFQTEVQIGDSLYQSRGSLDILLMRLEETGVGIAPVAANDDWGFRVYPNPAQNEITLQFNSGFQTQELFIEIFDITGRQVLNRHYQNPSQTMGMDISMLGKGMYFIRAHTGTNSKVEKILVY